MPPARCACGFTEDPGADETIADHLYEMFAPDDGKGPDGVVHLEGEVSFFCLCGAGGSAARLDAHLLGMCTPDDAIGRDGVRHRPVTPRRPRRALATVTGNRGLA